MAALAQFEDGFPATRLFNQRYSYTYNDVIFLPHYIDFPTDSVQLTTKLTRNIHLSTPCVASPMDTVTESSMAVSVAALGSMSIIHSNNFVSNQASLVQSTKSHRIPFVSNLIFKSPFDSVHSAHEFASLQCIFVIEFGTQKSKFLGVVTRSDCEKSIENKEARLFDYMIRSTIHVPSSYNFEDVDGYLAAKNLEFAPLMNFRNKLEKIILTLEMN